MTFKDKKLQFLSPNSTTTNENNEGNGDIDDEGEEKVDDVPTEIDLPTYFKLLAKSFCSPGTNKTGFRLFS